MNKQELINHIKDQNEWLGNHRFILIKKEELISMIEDLDEPQKVKVPLHVGNWIEYSKDEGWEFLRSIEEMTGPMGDGTVRRWFKKNSDKYAEAWSNDFEVEEEPEWVVKRGLFYFEEFDSQMNGDKFGFNGDRRLAKAHHFSDKSKAEAVADLIGGEVKKTKNDVSDSGPF